VSLLFVLSFCSRQSALTNQIFSCILKALRGRCISWIRTDNGGRIMDSNCGLKTNKFKRRMQAHRGQNAVERII